MPEQRQSRGARFSPRGLHHPHTLVGLPKAQSSSTPHSEGITLRGLAARSTGLVTEVPKPISSSPGVCSKNALEVVARPEDLREAERPFQAQARARLPSPATRGSCKTGVPKVWGSWAG